MPIGRSAATEYALVVSDKLANDRTSDRELENAFDEYQTYVRNRFLTVDATLLSDCAALVNIGRSVSRVLERI
jgi:hypothetical protein